MNSPRKYSSANIEERFSNDLEELLQTGSLPVRQDTSPEYQEMLQLASRFARIDPSQTSRYRLALRARLVNLATVQHQTGNRLSEGSSRPAHSSRQARSHRLALAGKWALGVAVLAAVIFGLVWIFSNVLPEPRPEPAAASTASPLPTEQPLPSPTPLAPLSLETPLEEILGRMTSPLWSTLWASGTALTEELAGQPQLSLVQAWIDRDGRGRVISSGSLPSDGFDPATTLPRFAWVSDGSRYALYDLQTGQPDPSSGLFGWANHALENAGPFMELVFPYYLSGRGGVFQAVSQDILAGRPVLIVEWRPEAGAPLQDRFWVDAETGQLLRRQTLLADEVTVVKDLRLDAVVYDQVFPQNLAGMADLANPADLAGIRFTSGPQDVLVPAEYLRLPEPVQPTPAPIPQVEVGGETLTLLQVDDPVIIGESGSGDLYLAKRVFSDETDGLIRLDDACVWSGSASCPVVEMDYPSLAWTPLYWSPDGSQAAHLDTNNNRLLLLDPLTNQWRALLEPFLSSAQLLFWSPQGDWIAASTQNEQGNGSLVTLVRADGLQQLAAPELGGMQMPLGWLADDQLLIMQWEDVQKGQVGQATAPTLYTVNLASGAWYPLPVVLGREAVGMLPVLSPDGTQLLVPADGGAGWAISPMVTDELSPLPAVGMNPTWSPDGQWIALVQVVEGVYQVNLVKVDGSEMQTVFEWAAFPVVTWSPDGLRLAIEASPAQDQPSASLFLLSLQDGALRQVLSENEPGSYELRYPSFRP